jgi:hypothetical protein
MKFIAALLIILSSVCASASTIEVYECLPSGTNVLYEDTFQVEVNRDGVSKLLYKRVINYRGRIINTTYEPVRGCSHAKLLKKTHHYYDIQIECENDGEEGFVDINRNSMAGEIYFYMPKIGYPERTGLKINCRRL